MSSNPAVLRAFKNLCQLYIIRRHREHVMLYSHTKIPYWVTVRGQDGVAGVGGNQCFVTEVSVLGHYYPFRLNVHHFF